MTKDRLEELRRRSQMDGKNENGKVAIDMGDSNEKTSLLDPFFGEVEKVQSQISSLKEDINKVQKIHSFLLNAREPDKKIIDDQQSELDRLNHHIKKSSIIIKNTLKQLKESNDVEASQVSSANNSKSKTPSTKLSPTQLRIRETQLSFLQKWFMDLMNEHSTSQSDYNDKHKRLLRTQLEVIGVHKSDEEFEKILSEPMEDIFTDNHLKMEKNARQQLVEVNARHKIILDIEKSIREVHDLFLEMAATVEAQGEMIDNIERQVTRAAEATKSGQGQLKEAREKKRSARNKKWMCYAIIGVLVVLFIAGMVTGYL